MQILIYVFATVFIFLALAMMFAYHNTGQAGLFLLSITYGASAVLALMLMQGWPLLAGFVLVWVLRFLGFDPDPRLQEPPQSRTDGNPDTEKEERS